MKTADQKRIEKLELAIEELTREIRSLRNEISIGNRSAPKPIHEWPVAPYCYPRNPNTLGPEIICFSPLRKESAEEWADRSASQINLSYDQAARTGVFPKVY